MHVSTCLSNEEERRVLPTTCIPTCGLVLPPTEIIHVRTIPDQIPSPSLNPSPLPLSVFSQRCLRGKALNDLLLFIIRNGTLKLSRRSHHSISETKGHIEGV